MEPHDYKAAVRATIQDAQLQKLHAKKVEIYLLATPTVILGKNGKAETVWIDEINHPLISKINELIELRTKQIMEDIHTPSNGDDK